MNKRDQQRLLNASKRLVQAIRGGGWKDPRTGERNSMYSWADHEIGIELKTKMLEQVLKSIERPKKGRK